MPIGQSDRSNSSTASLLPRCVKMKTKISYHYDPAPCPTLGTDAFMFCIIYFIQMSVKINDKMSDHWQQLAPFLDSVLQWSEAWDPEQTPCPVHLGKEL